MNAQNNQPLRSTGPVVQLALPKGRMEQGVITLLNEASIKVTVGSRAYRPSVSFPNFETKLLKPQNIIEMLELGTRDIGFAGADWFQELEVDLVELLDTGLDPVRLVAAAPTQVLEDRKLPKRPLVIASEYERLTKLWIERKQLTATFVRSFGATEVFPPEDADCIIDNTATGATLKANNLEILDELLTSSTRLYANPAALDDREKRDAIDRFVLLLNSVLEARQRVMVELNVTSDTLDAVIQVLPCLRHPTISPLHGSSGFAVTAAVPREDLARVIPEIKARGGTDIVVTNIAQLVP